MDIELLVENTLKPLGVPVARHHYATTTVNSYITFFEYNQRALKHADDEEVRTQYSIQVDVYTKGNPIQLVDKVKEAMKAKGFMRQNEQSTYEVISKTYRKTISFQYYSNNM